ncbi:hypothetical protein GCM10028798_34200 [Humibacter antri]
MAQRADVGVGTFYRNFPTKRDLLEALIVEQLDALSAVMDGGVTDSAVVDGGVTDSAVMDSAVTASGAPDSGTMDSGTTNSTTDSAATLADFVRAAFRGSQFKAELTAALEEHSSGFGEEVMAASSRLRKRLGHLLADAQLSGNVRLDIQLDDLLGLLSAGRTTTRTQDSAARIANVIIDGLRGQNGRMGHSRVFELRTYYTHPGKLDDLQTRFRDHTRALFEKHDMENVGYFVPADGKATPNTLVYLLAHASREAATASWDAFVRDPEWIAVKARSEENGPIIEHLESVFLNPTDFSELR